MTYIAIILTIIAAGFVGWLFPVIIIPLWIVSLMSRPVP